MTKFYIIGYIAGESISCSDYSTVLSQSKLR